MGPAVAIGSTGAAFPISTTSWSIWSCARCTMRCGSFWIPAWCGSLPTSPSIRAAAGAERAKKLERQRNEFLKQAWTRGETFLREAQTAYAARLRAENQPARSRERRAKRHRRRRDSTNYCAPPCACLRWRRCSRRRGPPRLAACCPAPARKSRRRRCGARCSPGARSSCWPSRSIRSSPEHSGARSLRSPAPARAVCPRLCRAWIRGRRSMARGRAHQSAAAGRRRHRQRAGTRRRWPRLGPNATEAASLSGKSASAGKVAVRNSRYDEKLALAPALWLDPDVRWLCGVQRRKGTSI